MRPPGKYDALRQAEQQAQPARDDGSQAKATAEPYSSPEEPTRPTGHPASPARWTDKGEMLLRPDWAKEIAQAAAQREAAVDQSKAKDDHER
jgi:hypothetical protein